MAKITMSLELDEEEKKNTNHRYVSISIGHGPDSTIDKVNAIYLLFLQALTYTPRDELIRVLLDDE